MILPSDANRKWNKATWQYMRRLGRCMDRAMQETGVMEKQMLDLIIYGKAIQTPEDSEKVSKRTTELMNGLKP